jgi:alkaline phosphatase D
MNVYSYTRYHNANTPHRLIVALLITAALLLGNPVHGRAADEDPLASILRPVVKPFSVRAFENYQKNRRYPEENFPMNAEKFSAFKRDVISRLQKTLKLDGWAVRSPVGKANALKGRFRDRLLKTIKHHGITMEVHLIEISETGDAVPAVVCLPAGNDRRPGVCVFSGHSRNGLRDLVLDLKGYQRGLATRLAKAGFVAIAVEKIDAGYLSKSFPVGQDEEPNAIHRLHWGRPTRSHQLMACLAASEILAGHPRVDETRIGAGGVSLGGWLSVQTALFTDRIQAVADFGMKGLHVDPDIKAEEFDGEFQLGKRADFCHILPGMLSLCDRNVLALTYCPRPLLAGHGSDDKISERQAPIHVKRLFERQYAALGQSGNFGYHVHPGGDTIPDEVVITYFRRMLEADKLKADKSVGIFHAQGEMSGEITPTSVLLQSRLTLTDGLVDPDLPGTRERFYLSKADVPGQAGVARFEVSARPDFKDAIRTEWMNAVPAADFIVKTKVSGLVPKTRYYYRLRYGLDRGTTRTGPICTFKTLGGPKSTEPTRFVVVTGMCYVAFHRSLDDLGTRAYSGRDKSLGFPALEAIRRRKPDFFVGTGDNVYYDTFDLSNPRAKSQVELRRKWHAQFVQPRFKELFSQVGTYWEKDDHDFRYNDCDLSGQREPSAHLGIKTFVEQVPVVDPNDESPITYRTHRVSRDLQIWLVEGRDFRSPNAMSDGPTKTVWGKRQRDWIKRTLLESNATFKILISPTPMIGPDRASKRDNHTNPRGFRYEGEEFFRWLKTNGISNRSFFIACGDRHWQYQAVHPTGFEEFSCGALVDANAIKGINPGDPGSTDPNGTIKHRYTQSKPSGGFLEIDVRPATSQSSATARFTFFDENGVKLFESVKTAPM